MIYNFCLCHSPPCNNLILRFVFVSVFGGGWRPQFHRSLSIRFTEKYLFTFSSNPHIDEENCCLQSVDRRTTANQKKEKKRNHSHTHAARVHLSKANRKKLTIRVRYLHSHPLTTSLLAFLSIFYSFIYFHLHASRALCLCSIKN